MQNFNWVAVATCVICTIVLIEATYLTVMKLRQRQLKVARGSMLLDSCALMDGRIVDLAKTGIITAEIIVPRSVVVEMQLLADKADHEKRVRARKGLENVRVLKAMDSVSVAIVNDGRVGHGGVDERLLDLAKNYDASIATTDFNLNRVAKVMDVPVINVNEIAQVMRAQYLPGDRVEIELIQQGANRDQAVGYLNDGTMVVVEDCKNLIGQKVKVEIIRSLQTEAGRMMFAKKVETKSSKGTGHTNAKTAKAVKTIRASRKDKTASAKIKSAPAFHSDQLKNSSNTSLSQGETTKHTSNTSLSQRETTKHTSNTSLSQRETTKHTSNTSLSQTETTKRTSNTSLSQREVAQSAGGFETKKTTKKPTTHRRRPTQKAAEAEMVKLANATADSNK